MRLTIDGYEIGDLIGSGGSAYVYAAFDSAGREVAIKVLRNPLVGQKAREQFEREVEIYRRIGEHPHILSVFDFGLTTAQEPYIVMERMVESLQQRIDRDGPLDLDRAIAIVSDAARALDYAHDQGVVHRDLKPGNLLINSELEVTIADFGIAKIIDATASLSTQIALTPAYAPPERFRGEAATGASDVYSLAMTFLTLATGQPPFNLGDSPNAEASMFKALYSDPDSLVSLQAPWHVRNAIERAIAKDPRQRTQTPSEFVRALNGLHEPTDVGPTHEINYSHAPTTDLIDPGPATTRTNNSSTAPRTETHQLKAGDDTAEHSEQTRATTAVLSRATTITFLIVVVIATAITGWVSWQARLLNNERDSSTAGENVAADDEMRSEGQSAFVTVDANSAAAEAPTPGSNQQSSRSATRAPTENPEPTRSATSTPQPSPTPTAPPTATPRPSPTPAPIKTNSPATSTRSDQLREQYDLPDSKWPVLDDGGHDQRIDLSSPLHPKVPAEFIKAAGEPIAGCTQEARTRLGFGGNSDCVVGWPSWLKILIWENGDVRSWSVSTPTTASGGYSYASVVVNGRAYVIGRPPPIDDEVFSLLYTSESDGGLSMIWEDSITASLDEAGNVTSVGQIGGTGFGAPIGDMQVTADNVNLRAAPNEGSRVIHLLRHGDYLYMMSNGHQDGSRWYRVVDKKTKLMGWVDERYVVDITAIDWD